MVLDKSKQRKEYTMNVTKLCLVLSLVAVTAMKGSTETPTKAKEGKPAFAIRELQKQVVLYTIYRGDLNDIGSTITELYSLAAANGIYPEGPITFAYLNTSRHISSKHWVTEVRLPVDKRALEVAGKLGKMTDIKTISAMKVAVATKPKGMADSAPIYKNLYPWMLKHGHMSVSGPQETFLANVETGDYLQMKTEIMVPIWDSPADRD